MSHVTNLQLGLSELPDGAVVSKATVTIKKIYPSKEGAGWKCTGTVVMDDFGNQCSCSFFSDPAVPLQINETGKYDIESRMTNKGLSGLTKESYQGKPQLKVSKFAIINPAGQSPTQAPQQQEQQPAYAAPQQPMQQQMPQSPPPQQQAPPTPSGGDPRATYVASWMATFGSALKTLEAAAPHLSVEVKAQVASQCASDVPGHWFGKKSLEKPEG